MSKLPPEPIVRRGNVLYLVYVVGGLLMTVTAGSLCVDVAVRTAQDPANLLRLSNTLIRLMGLGHRANSSGKRKLRRLYFADSLDNLLDAARHDFLRFTQFPSSPERRVNLKSVNCISAKRRRIFYILLCGVSSRPMVTLRMGDKRSKPTNCSPSHLLQWLVDFSAKARDRGDVIVLLVDGQISQIGAKHEAESARNERRPTRLTLGLSALSVVLLWMFLPHIAVCAAVLFSWKLKQHNQ